MYGGGAAKIAETAGISRAEADTFVAEYDARLPFVKETYRWVDSVAQRRGFVRSLSGRRHRFELWEPADWDLSKTWPPFAARDAALEAVRGEVERRRERGEPAPRSGVRRARTYRALNRLLQGGAADAIKAGMVAIWESGVVAALGPPLVTVHDELGFSAPKTRAGRAAVAEAARLLEAAATLRVPLRVERQAGPSWGACG